MSGLAILAACGSDSSSDGQPTQTAEAVYSLNPSGAVKGGKITATTSPVGNFNPVSVYINGTTLAGPTVYDRILSAEVGSPRYTLEAAQTVENPDPLKVVVKLKPGMVYHNVAPVNGRAVKASDVVASQDYVLKLANAYDKSFQTNYLERMEAPDDSTFVLHLKKPDAYLYGSNHLGNSTSQAIIPAEALDNLNTMPWVGSGPYQLKESQIDQRYVFSRFDKFRDAANVYVDEREFLILRDLAAIEAGLRSGQIDVGSNTYPTADRIASEMGDRVRLSEVEGVTLSAIHLNMATDLPWKRDMRVRQAMYRFTNRQQVTDFAIKDKATISTGTMPAGVTDYLLSAEETAQYYKTDPKEAKQLLDAAGFDYSKEWEVIPFGGVPGSIQEQTMIVWTAQAAEVGFKTRLNGSLPTSQVLSDVIARARFEIFFANAPGGNDPAYALRLYHTDALSQYTHFGMHDPAIDAMIEKAESMVDYEDNVKFVKQLQLEMLKKYPSPFAFFTAKWRVLYNSRIQNYDIRPLLPRYNTKAWIKPAGS